MPKIGSLWTKSFDKDGEIQIKHSGTVEIDGAKFYLDVYPKRSENPKAPAFDVYLKPVKTEDIPF
jgi:hypothetical protein